MMTNHAVVQMSMTTASLLAFIGKCIQAHKLTHLHRCTLTYIYTHSQHTVTFSEVTHKGVKSEIDTRMPTNQEELRWRCRGGRSGGRVEV